MDLSRPVTYRGLLLNGAEGGPGGNNPINGIRLTRVRYSEVSVHGYTEKRSLDDGMDASDVFMGGRRIIMQGEVYADTKASLFDRLDLLRLKMTPTDAYNEAPSKHGYVPLTFSQATLHLSHWPTGFIDRELRCRPSVQPEYDIVFGAINSDDDTGYVVPFVALLEAKDPRFYNPTVIEEYISGSVGSGTLVNRGSYPSPLNILLSVSDTDPGGVFDFTGMGTNMVVTIPNSINAQVVRIDGEKKVVTLTENGAEALRMDLIVFNAGTTWAKVPPTPEGESPAGYDYSYDGTLEAASRLFYSEAWA